MTLIDILFLFGCIIYLEDHALFGANEDALDWAKLHSRRGVIKWELKIKDRKDSISSLVVEDDRSSSQVRVFDSPETNIFLSAGDKLIIINGRVFET